jgi:hypothetical protein
MKSDPTDTNETAATTSKNVSNATGGPGAWTASKSTMNLYILMVYTTKVHILHEEANIDVHQMFVDFNKQHGKGKNWLEVADLFLTHLKRDHGFQELNEVIIQKLL